MAKLFIGLCILAIGDGKWWKLPSNKKVNKSTLEMQNTTEALYTFFIYN